jgi:muramoyltetrapeptide carboxypeptidase
VTAWTRPRALRPGDVVGVCAPSGPVPAEALDRGVQSLRTLGFDVRVPPGLLERTRFTAGSLERRLEELTALLTDEGVAAIVCARGGGGALGLLPRLDAELIRGHPKALVGYSDVTFLHLWLHRLGLVTLHGPMVARELADGTFHRDSLWHALTGQGTPYATEADELLPLRAGVAQGRLRGGCLSILASAAGTPWALAPGGEDTILFLEDVDEPPYRIDRMLRQLLASGGLGGVRGIVFGDMKGCSPPLSEGYTLEDVVLDALAGWEGPVALGLSSGHATGPQVTLPLGVPARLECEGEEARFRILEAPVV